MRSCSVPLFHFALIFLLLRFPLSLFLGVLESCILSFQTVDNLAQLFTSSFIYNPNTCHMISFYYSIAGMLTFISIARPLPPVYLYIRTWGGNFKP